MAKKNNRVAFMMTNVEYEALRLMAKDEDSQAALLRRLIREEAQRHEIWGKAYRSVELRPKV